MLQLLMLPFLMVQHLLLQFHMLLLQFHMLLLQFHMLLLLMLQLLLPIPLFSMRLLLMPLVPLLQYPTITSTPILLSNHILQDMNLGILLQIILFSQLTIPVHQFINLQQWSNYLQM